jgi:hypothetical protein
MAKKPQMLAKGGKVKPGMAKDMDKDGMKKGGKVPFKKKSK